MTLTGYSYLKKLVILFRIYHVIIRVIQKVLLFSVLSAIGDYCEAISIFNLETKQLKPITEYEVLIAPSGIEQTVQIIYLILFYILSHFIRVKKPKYINLHCNADGAFGTYLYENCYIIETAFRESSKDTRRESMDNKKKNKKFTTLDQ